MVSQYATLKVPHRGFRRTRSLPTARPYGALTRHLTCDLRVEPYCIQYTDHRGKRCTVQGFTDKGLSEQLAAKLESEARSSAHRLVDAEQESYIEQKQAPIGPHVDAFEESLSDNSGKHVSLTMTRVRRIIDGGEFKTLADISVEAVQTCLRAIRKSDDLGHRTYNHYVQAVDSFCNWCVSTKRLLANPLLPFAVTGEPSRLAKRQSWPPASPAGWCIRFPVNRLSPADLCLAGLPNGIPVQHRQLNCGCF